MGSTDLAMLLVHIDSDPSTPPTSPSSCPVPPFTSRATSPATASAAG